MNNRIILVFAVLLILLSGCGASRISFDVLVPAIRTVPAEIKSVTIMNRSFPENIEANRLEGFLTGEGLDQDTLATQYVLRGLDESLRGSARFKVIKASELYTGSGIGTLLPEALPWETVNYLCDKYNTDALVALEAYDSDFVITGAAVGSDLLDLQARGLVTVNCGFRMYYPTSRSILDEFMFMHRMDWGTGGFSIVAAADAIINRKRAIENASLEAGSLYGNRLTPDWIYISRDYFKRGKGNFDLAEGARMMQLNDWDKAIAALERALQSNKRKVRGRAAHNLAVIYEILGDLFQAKEWTTVAWGQYRVRKSREYGYILTRRIQEQEVIEYQLGK
jgi:tetratricopeptide (TPR) repeat protein